MACRSRYLTSMPCRRLCSNKELEACIRALDLQLYADSLQTVSYDQVF